LGGGEVEVGAFALLVVVVGASVATLGNEGEFGVGGEVVDGGVSFLIHSGGVFLALETLIFIEKRSKTVTIINFIVAMMLYIQ